MSPAPAAMSYPVNEIFQSIQGEGWYTGTPTIFVRLQGCPVGCPWCDTQHSWVVDPDHQVDADRILNRSNASPNWSPMRVEEMLHSFAQSGYTARHVVITGGEPCLYDLTELSATLLFHGYSVQIETSGTSEIQADERCWVTLSPKINMKGGLPVLSSAVERAQEIKHPVAMARHIQELDHLLSSCRNVADKVICLQPISTQPRATALAMRVCIERNWRLSVQLHKYLQID